MAEPGKFQNDDHRLYLEDLEVGRRFTSATHAIDEAQIRAFATQFDPQPFHLDDAAAKATLFGGLAASGWHTAAITMRLLVESGLPLRGGIVGAGGEINWPKPTRPGDILQVVSEVEEVVPSRSRPDRGMVKVRSETRNQRGEVVQVLLAKLIVPRRAATSPQPQGELAARQAGRAAKQEPVGLRAALDCCQNPRACPRFRDATSSTARR